MAAEVLLRSVLITDLEYLGTSGTWISCRARDKEADTEFENTVPLKWVDGDGNGNGIPLVDNPNPQQPNPTEVEDINFDGFKLDNILGDTTYTLFHPKQGGLGTYANRKTTMIRYKTVCVIVDNDTPFSTKSSDYYYAMIRASFDDDNTLIEGSPENSLNSTFAATLKFRFPGFTSNQLGTDAYNSLRSILTEPNNWKLTLRSGGKEKKYTPTSVNVGTPVETSSSYTDFGVAYFPITLGVTFTGVSSGDYTLSAQFEKNDEGDADAYLSIPAEFMVTVQLTLGTAIPTQQVIITDDGEVKISVAIQTGSGL